MKTAIIIFIVVATVFALATLGYVIYDVITDKNGENSGEDTNK